MKDQCSYINRLPVHPSIRAGVSTDQCENECVPGLNVCLDHANKDALWMMIQSLNNKIKKLKLTKTDTKNLKDILSKNILARLISYTPYECGGYVLENVVPQIIAQECLQTIKLYQNNNK
jgi:hypothetical protein